MNPLAPVINAVPGLASSDMGEFMPRPRAHFKPPFARAMTCAMALELLEDGPARSEHRLVLAHGAGAAMDSEFMNVVAAGVGAAGIRVLRFEFPYMRAQRSDGRRHRPDTPRVLLATWREVMEQLGGARRLVIGGKSMGGRIASMLADEVGARGLVCLGYPFHPAGKPERTRVEHLRELTTPALFVQGTRDTLGNRQEVEAYTLSPKIELCWLEDGDHSFKPRKKSGRTLEQAMDEAIQAVARFVLAR